MANWKNLFNTNHKSWEHGIDQAVEVAREANYPMVLWKGKAYAVPEEGAVDLKKWLCRVAELE